MYRYQLARFSRGKATSRAPIIRGSRKLPSVAGIDGNQKEPHHHDAMEREGLVVGLGAHQRAVGRNEIQADQGRGGAAEEEEKSDAERVEDCDALVVVRRSQARRL